MSALEYRPRARLDFNSIIIRLGVELDNPKAAKKAADNIYQAIDRLCLFPESGTVVFSEEFPASRFFRKTYAHPYVIFYRYANDTVTIYRILHERQHIDDYALIPQTP